MHELSLCGAIVDTVTEHAGGRTVTQVNLTIGHFRQVVPETLLFCWEMRTKDSDLESCALNIEPVPAVIACSDCGASTTLTHPILRCGSCDSANTTMVTGEEFLITSIDLEPLERKSTKNEPAKEAS